MSYMDECELERAAVTEAHCDESSSEDEVDELGNHQFENAFVIATQAVVGIGLTAFAALAWTMLGCISHWQAVKPGGQMETGATKLTI